MITRPQLHVPFKVAAVWVRLSSQGVLVDAPTPKGKRILKYLIDEGFVGTNKPQKF
jgi:hypothetical protein